MLSPLHSFERREKGQTLIIALIVMGLLLILGFVFLGIVDRNIHGAKTSQTRSETNDLAEAGIRFAQSQLVNGPLGADWRGTPVQLTTTTNANMTNDPDAWYLRPPNVDNTGKRLPFLPGSTQEDLGGPDGLGFFTRVVYDRGRSLIRVRWASSDANFFLASPTGPLRNPGSAHNYLIIESIGRLGKVNVQDPTTLLPGAGLQFQGFPDAVTLQAGLAALHQADQQIVNGRRLIAFATPGITNFARYETNLFKVSRPVDFGVPTGLGVLYLGNDVGTLVSETLGTNGTIPAPTTTAVPASGGTMMVNGDLIFHGTSVLNLNQYLGDKIIVNGVISADQNAQVQFNLTQYNVAANSWITNSTTENAAQLGSRSNGFTTLNGTVLDGLGRTDQAGNPRGVGGLQPPRINNVDAQTKETRYLLDTRESGVQINGQNSGEYGHGQGPYIDNTTDRQIPTDETGRAGAGSQESLIYDWLNPNNTDQTSGWVGPLYIPKGAYVRLLPDGFTIQRDDKTWRNPDGTDSGVTTVRYRIGLLNGKLTIVDSLETNVNGAVGTVNWGAGQPFNGVLYFEGNVRIRGTIPTNVQLTVVSDATIYIEGSITKGVTGNDVTQAQGVANYNTALTQPSRSMLMLMAKDYVAVNTTQFTGMSPGETPQPANDQPDPFGLNPIRLAAAGGIGTSRYTLTTELLTDPTTGTANNPSSWAPYAMKYTDSINNGILLPTKLLLTHAMDDGLAPASFIGMNVNFGVYGSGDQHESIYFFPGTQSLLPGYFPGLSNTASDYLGSGAGSISMEGLGSQAYQRYPKFESRAFNLVWPATSAYANQTITSTLGPNNEPFINYSLFAPGGNEFLLRPEAINGVASNNYLLARFAVTPGDVRIEASIYAEEGSFFIIPGPWFNTDVNDTRDAHLTRINALKNLFGMTQAQAEHQANTERLNDHGNSPDTPFYGEPLDVHVSVIGSVSENMPPPLSVQTEYQRKWSWIPVQTAASDFNIPASHVPAGVNASTVQVVPNFVISYDPELATGRVTGYTATNDPSDLIRVDSFGRALPPMPRLPVSPALTYFGEVQ